MTDFFLSPTTDPAIAKALSKMIEKNKEELIKTSVSDPETQKALIEINERIAILNKKDPGLVSAWGAGCGGSCAVAPGGFGDRISNPGIRFNR